MDARTAIRTTICAAAMIITLQSCTNPPPPPSAAAEPELQFTGYDFTTAAGTELQNLDIFLQSVTTTTSITRVPTQQITSGTDRWDILAQCETGGDWATNTGNGFGGGLQFAHSNSWSTWRAYGGDQFTQHPWEATREQQIIVAERVLQSAGWGAWPGCARLNGWNQ